MSGPHSDQIVHLEPREVAALLYAYQYHRPDPDDGLCRCKDPNCTMRRSCRGRLWVGGIDPDQPQDTAEMV